MRKQAVKHWFMFIFWTGLLIGVVPFVRVELTSTYQWIPVVAVLSFVYTVVMVYGMAVFIKGTSDITWHESVTFKRKVTQTLIGLFDIVLWPLRLFIDAVKSTIVIFKEGA